jgi:hypothetical protein
LTAVFTAFGSFQVFPSPKPALFIPGNSIRVAGDAFAGAGTLGPWQRRGGSERRAGGGARGSGASKGTVRSGAVTDARRGYDSHELESRVPTNTTLAS